MRILVAEDETLIRLDLCELLERAGHEVCAQAKDGAEAVIALVCAAVAYVLVVAVQRRPRRPAPVAQPGSVRRPV